MADVKRSTTVEEKKIEEKEIKKPVAKEEPKPVAAAKQETVKKAEPVAEVKAEAGTEEKAQAVKSTRKTAAKAAEKKTARKTAEKKTAAKKTTKKTREKAEQEPVKTVRIPSAAKNAGVYIQFNNKEQEFESLKSRIIEKWCEDEGRKPSAIKEMNIYIKPEDNAAYYVINGQGSSIELYV